MQIDFIAIVEAAWREYDSSRSVLSINDISAMVSTNHVFRLRLEDESVVIAKFYYFGTYEDFLEDHSLINALANNLPAPYDQFLSRSLLKKNQLFTYRHQDALLDAWVVFYNPIRVDQKLPRRLDENQIEILGGNWRTFSSVLPSTGCCSCCWRRPRPSPVNRPVRWSCYCWPGQC